jgi:hypothetical protein
MRWRRVFTAVLWLRRLAPTSQREVPVSIPGQPMWDLWWTEWRWDRISSEFFGFRQSISLRQCCTHLHLHGALTGRTNGICLGTMQKAAIFRKLGALNRKVLWHECQENVSWLGLLVAGNGKYRVHEFDVVKHGKLWCLLYKRVGCLC